MLCMVAIYYIMATCTYIYIYVYIYIYRGCILVAYDALEWAVAEDEDFIRECGDMRWKSLLLKGRGLVEMLPKKPNHCQISSKLMSKDKNKYKLK